MESINIFYLNSALANTKDLTRSTASFVMSPNIIFPQNSKLKVACQSFSFTNYFINVSAVLANNTFTIESDVPAVHTIVIPDGSYNVSELSQAVNIGVINEGLADGLVQLIPDFPTNRVIFSISLAGYRLSFPAGSPFALLGTTLNQYIPAEVIPGTPVYTAAPYSELAPNVATFNSIQNIYLHTSLTNNSIFSGQQSNVIASIVPTVPIGSIQAYEPYNLTHIDAHELSAANISNITIYLTDQSNNPISLQDDFAATIQISRVIEPIIQINNGMTQMGSSQSSIKRPEAF